MKQVEYDQFSMFNGEFSGLMLDTVEGGLDEERGWR